MWRNQGSATVNGFAPVSLEGVRRVIQTDGEEGFEKKTGAGNVSSACCEKLLSAIIGASGDSRQGRAIPVQPARKMQVRELQKHRSELKDRSG